MICKCERVIAGRVSPWDVVWKLRFLVIHHSSRSRSNCSKWTVTECCNRLLEQKVRGLVSKIFRRQKLHRLIPADKSEPMSLDPVAENSGQWSVMIAVCSRDQKTETLSSDCVPNVTVAFFAIYQLDSVSVDISVSLVGPKHSVNPSPI